MCKRWHRIILASSTRLDLFLVAPTNNPGNIKTIFSPHLSSLPIVIEHGCQYASSDLKAKQIGRMFSALERYDRVRGITLSRSAPDFDKLFEAAKCSFPILELCKVDSGRGTRLRLPATFLEGSAPHFRRLKLHCFPLRFITSFSSSAR